MNRFKELKVWQKSVELSTEIYRLTEKIPNVERYGLISQMTRCAVSIPSNIAEGSGRNTKGEFNQFLGIALGSSFELETQIIIARNLNYIKSEVANTCLSSLHEIQSMLFGLKKSLK